MNFILTVDQAIEFYKRCAAEKANTLEERLVVMKKMVEERRAFKQTPEQIKKRLKNKNVLRLNWRTTKDEPSDSGSL